MRRTIPTAAIQPLLRACRYAVIASVTPDGHAWNTPVAAAFDDDCAMYWGSAAASRHSRNLARDPHIFVVSFGHEGSAFEGQGVYLQMHARSLETKAEVMAARRFYDASFFETYHPGISFLDDCPTRLYTAEPLRIWRNIDVVRDGYFTDVRLKVGSYGKTRH